MAQFRGNFVSVSWHRTSNAIYVQTAKTATIFSIIYVLLFFAVLYLLLVCVKLFLN